METSKALEILDELYKEVNGHSLSFKGRDAHQYTDKSLVYGEIKFETFYQIIQDANPKSRGVFYDLGSGTGKPVFLAYLFFDFSQCTGIELVDTLYESSIEVLNQFESTIKPSLGSDFQNKQITFLQGSFLDFDFTDADLIFMNSTCFSDELMANLEAKFEHLKPGTKIITLTKSLQGSSFEIIKSKMCEFSWGEATVYYHEKQK